MRRFRRILTLALLPLFLAGCGSGGEEPDESSGSKIELDCSDPVFSRTEPLPSGTHPEGWVTTGSSYWVCDGGREYYHADGTVTGEVTDTFLEELNPLLVAFWNACRVGTRPPELSGNWVVADEALCVRFDITPGIIICADIISEPDGNSVTRGGDVRTIQYGQVIESAYEEADTCYLEGE